MPYLLQQLLENSAKQYPDREAVVYKDSVITYQELDIAANKLGWALRNAGIEKGDRVGICLNKSIEEIVAIYGILKAGAVYVPIDPASPTQRIAYFIENCKSKALVTTKKIAAKLYQEFLEQVTTSLQCVILVDEDLTENNAGFSQAKIVTWQQVLQSPT